MKLSGILAATLTSVVALSSANAADMYRAPEGVSYKDTPYVAVNWAGLYLGGAVGGAFTDFKVTDKDEVPGAFKNDTSGLIGSGTIGYNWQGVWHPHLVLGIEADLGGIDLNHTAIQSGTGGYIASKIDSGFYADVTGRLGYALDKTLFYAKGGYAYYGGKLSNIDKGEALTTVTGLSGWTVGGGVEYKLSPAWSVKAEYQYFDFGTEHLSLASDGDRYDNQLAIHTVKAGVNYHFGNDYAPLK